MSAHTKGPWKQGDYILWPSYGADAQFPIHAPKRGRIALALRKEADARLIAAAPELLEALHLMLRGTQEDCGRICMPRDEAVRAAFAAIAKAEVPA